jgi:hypothetical protein
MIHYLYYYVNVVVRACTDFVKEINQLEGRVGDIIARIIEAGRTIEELVQRYGGIPREVNGIPKSIAEILTKLNLAKVEGDRVVFHRIADVYKRYVECTHLLSRVFEVR